MNDALRMAIEMLRPVIAEAAKDAVDRSAGLDGMDTARITDEVTKNVAAVVVNQTNAEPWYQSTVTIGALIAVVGGGYGLGYEFLVNGPPTPAEFGTLATPVVGGLVTLWGRWFQKKPIGG